MHELELVTDPAPEDIRRLEQGVMAATEQRLGDLGRVGLGVFARDANGEIIGGVTGRTVIGWLLIHVAWVHPDHQGTGLGSRLMRAAEDEARRRGCIGSQVDTLSVQAPDFYLKLGYEVIGTVPECPPGGARYFFAKRFDRDA